jgi:hypothetical protein
VLSPTIAWIAARRLAGKDAIGVKVGEVISKYSMAKHFDPTVADG